MARPNRTRILAVGPMATVELKTTDDHVQATCIDHSTSDARLAPPGNCSWTTVYLDWLDATEFVVDHTDRGIQ